MMAWLGFPGCPVACLEIYLVKREPRWDALWQKPKNHNAASFSQDDDIWCCSISMGKHKLDNLLKEMCKKAGLATIYIQLIASGLPRCQSSKLPVLKTIE